MDRRIEEVKHHYDADPEGEWERLESHPFEFILTTWMMERYIRPGDSILDIGGGPGRYSVHFAKRGCAVTLAELSPGNVELARRKAAEAGVELTAHAVNCLELDGLDLGRFDHVFLMGPLYHLLEEADRVRAVEIALEHLKPGGKLYASFILLFAGLLYDLQNGGHIVSDCANPAAARLIDAVAAGQDYGGPAFTAAYFYHQRNILPFMERFDVKKLHLFGQEGILAPNYRDILSRDREEQDQWIALAKQYLELPELLAYSEHAMYIGERPEAGEPEIRRGLRRLRGKTFSEGGVVIRELRDDDDLWYVTAECALGPGQEAFVNPAGFSIGRAYLDPGSGVPCVICLEDGTRIGYIIFREWMAAGAAFNWSYYLDRRWQGRGCGERAARLAVRILREADPTAPIKLSAEADNTRARRLYEKIGFELLDETDGDDLVFCLRPQC